MSATPPDTPPAGTSDDASDELIRQVMTAQKRVNSREIFPDLEPADSDEQSNRSLAKRRKKTRNPAKAGKDSFVTRALAKLKARVLGYRPKIRHFVWAALVLVVWFRPLLIPGLLFVTFWIGLIAWLTLGPDRVVELLSTGWQRMVTRHPKTADRLRTTADKFALKFDAILERLPDHWAEKLSLPDLSQPAKPEASFDDRPDPFERLKTPEVYRG